MKLGYLLSVMFFCMMHLFANAQGINCTAKVHHQIVYKKSKFTPLIILPKVDLPNMQTSQNINSYLTLKALSGMEILQIEDQIKENKLNDNEMGLSSLSFDIKFNKNCLLSLAIYTEYVGSYLNNNKTFKNFDLKNGKLLNVKTVFNNQLHKKLVILANQKLQNVIKTERNYLEKTDKENLEMFDDFILTARFKESNLNNFYIDESLKTIVFVYDFGFPSAFKTIEPANEITFSLNEITPFIATNGNLAFLIQH